MGGIWTHWPAGSCKTADVVVGRVQGPISVGPVGCGRGIARFLRDSICDGHCGRHDDGRRGDCKPRLGKERQLSSSEQLSGQ